MEITQGSVMLLPQEWRIKWQMENDIETGVT